MNKSLKIVQVSPSLSAGGAENSAGNLHRRYLDKGLQSRLFVGGGGDGNEEHVIGANNDGQRNRSFRWVDSLIKQYDRHEMGIPGTGRVLRFCRKATEPVRSIKIELGIEDFSFPGTRQLIDLASDVDIIHCHNLHGNYFDLNLLPELCKRCGVVLNVREAWLMTGHCAMPLECQKWLSGCGQCPDLDRYPSVKRDATAHNWKRKAGIFQRSAYFLTAPSEWMLHKAENSILKSGAVGSNVIPNGYDEALFFPASKSESKQKLGFDENDIIIMTAGFDIRHNIWKNFPVLLRAVEQVAERSRHKNVRFLVIGAEQQTHRLHDVEVRYLPFMSNQADLADYYRAADIYLHGALVESFGNTLLEAKACGTAIVSSGVGGIPEHVNSMEWSGLPDSIHHYPVDNSHGLLVESGNVDAMASALIFLLATFVWEYSQAAV